MKLRLYHHHDGARVAYREAGAGPALALLHSAMLSHKEWEPVTERLTERFRLVLPDLPLHGDSETGSRYPYTPQWFADVLAGFCDDVLGPRPLLGGHGLGAEVLLAALAGGGVSPERVVLMPNRLHGRRPRQGLRRAARLGASVAAVPGVGWLASHSARLFARPELGPKLSARGAPEAADLVRHAFADVGGNGELARAWARFARHWPVRPQRELLELYPAIEPPLLLLWADSDEKHPLAVAEEALELLPHGQLRVLSGTGYLIAYDDPVGVARELVAFCG